MTTRLAIRLTDRQRTAESTELPDFLASMRSPDVDFAFVIIPHITILDLAHGFANHGSIHNSNRGNVQDRGLALEFRVEPAQE